MSPPNRAVFVGRFQPPHIGHLRVIEYILNEVDEVIVVIAAAQLSHTKKNPLTAGERVTLMRLMLQNTDIDPSRYWVIPAQDIMDNALWIPHLKRLLPEFHIYYGNNPFVRMLFKEAGYEVRTTPMFDRPLYEASTIRQQIIDDQNVKNVLDNSVFEFLQEIDIKQRFLGIITSDSADDKVKVSSGSELTNLVDK